MRIDLRKSVLAAIFATLGTTLAVGQALAGGRANGPNGPFAPPGSMGQGENVVVTLQTDPFLDSEPSCVGVQIATNLLLDDVNGDDPGGKVKPASSVTLFATLGGVEAVSPGIDMPPFDPALDCLTPNGIVPLPMVIANFLNKGGEIVICPLCWTDRYPDPGQEPPFQDPAFVDDAVIADAVSLHNLFLRADKVIDF